MSLHDNDPSVQAERISNAQNGRRLSNGSYICHCPAHEDKTPSLSVTATSDKVLLHCHSGCSSKKVIAALVDLNLWARSTKRSAQSRNQTNDEVEAIYDYRLEDGTLVYQVVRKLGKKFVFRQPQGQSFKYDLKGVTRIPYRLPELVGAIKGGEKIFIVEGEKDVDNLRKIGLVATCNPTGANNWKNSYSKYLKGADVIILPDNDSAGSDHAAQVASSLNGKVQSVKTLNLPGLPVKGDVSDWLAEGGDKDQLLRLTKEASPYSAGNEKKSDAKSDHYSIALDVIAQIGKDNILHSKGAFWKWDECGVWRQMIDREVRRYVHQMAVSNLRKSLVDSVIDLVKTEVSQEDIMFDQNVHSINCLNGELNLIKSGWELFPHERNNYRITQIPLRYEPEARADLFQHFLTEIFEGDEDDVEKMTIILEMIGYSLMTSPEFEKFILLLGSGANGKSVLLHVVEALCGRKNVSAVIPSQLDNKFQRAHLHGKLANIVCEIAEGAVIPDAPLKSIVSGDLVTAEHKHKTPFEFHPHCTCWFGTNHLPHTRDFSNALFRRAIIIEFNRKFEGANCDVKLKDKLVEELPGILNLSLSRIEDVIRRGYFSDCKSNKAVKSAWQLEADQAAQFFEDKCEAGREYRVESSKCYKAYQEWVDDVGVKRSLTQRSLTNRLKRLGVEPHKGTAGARMLTGMRLKVDLFE